MADTDSGAESEDDLPQKCARLGGDGAPKVACGNAKSAERATAHLVADRNVISVRGVLIVIYDCEFVIGNLNQFGDRFRSTFVEPVCLLLLLLCEHSNSLWTKVSEMAFLGSR